MKLPISDDGRTTMFKEMRRKKQALSAQECTEVLAGGEWGVLGLNGDDGFPYTVPLNYVYHNGEVIFHSARAGHKVDAIARDARASFCVVDRSELVPEKFATAYRSVIVFGRLRKLDDPEERARALTALVEALAGCEPEDSKRNEVDTCRMRDNVEVFALSPEHISGKQAIPLR